jgi:L-rhamnonate dehydratase
MRVTKLRIFELTGYLQQSGPFWEDRLSRPIDVYPEHNTDLLAGWTHDQVGDDRYKVASWFLEIETDEGVTGLGGPAPREWVDVIAHELAPFVVGQDPLAIERIWDSMYRFVVHGRKGVVMQAISVVDCALWDLKGKWANASVCRLLGGPTRTELPVYASMLGFSIDPERAQQRAAEYAAHGYRAQKWFFRHGPPAGRDGVKKNVALARAVRDAVGEDDDVMLDCWMSWNVPYTIEMADLLEDVHPRWLEEPVMPDLVASYAEIRRAIRIPISGGEHEYTRWGVKTLLDAEAVDVVQADTYWAGGISEMLKIGALCSAYDRPVIPHGHSVPANVQLIASQPAWSFPMVEYLVKWNQINQFFFKEPLVPRNGVIGVPDRAGVGMEIDEAKISERRELGEVSEVAASAR